MLKCFLCATAIIVSICGFVQNNLKAGSVACGVKLNSDPSPYPSVIFLLREVKLVEMPEFTG